MKHIFFYLSAFLLLLFQGVRGQAQSSDPAGAIPETENALLWEISGKDLKRPSYLFGTIHLIGKEDYELKEVTRRSLDKAELVTFEINMDDMMDFSKLMPLLMSAFMAGDTTLEDLLSEADYALVETHFSKMGLPMMFFNRIKPMFLSALSSEDMLSMDGDNSSIVSYEMELMKIAKSQNKEIGGLETAQYQMSMFDSIPYKVQADMLVESIRTTDTGTDQFEEMVKLYKNEDLKGMQAMFDSEEGGIGSYDEILLVGRNKNWIPIMSEMMREKPTFFAVGAGHLGGEYGVVALLRKAGYTLQPLRK